MKIFTKKYAYGFLVILLITLIFIFSSQNGLYSNMMSLKIAEKIREYTIPVSEGTNIKLTKEGNTFTGYYSTGGDDWIEIGKLTNTDMNSTYTGLAVSSLNDEKLCSAEFSNVKLELDSQSISFTPSKNEDIGAVGVKGSIGCNNGIYNVKGSGADIWNAADKFHFAYKQIPGSFSITARVDSIQNTNGNAKAGIMIRNTLDTGSQFVDVVVTPMKKVSFQWRDKKGISCITKDYGSISRNKPADMETYNFIVRKSFHFIEFLIMTILLYRGCRSINVTGRKRLAAAFVFCLLLAFMDEFHQIFVPQREPSLRDVFIDTAGSALGIVLICVRNVLKKRGT